MKWIAEYSQIDSYSRYKRQTDQPICVQKCMEMPKMDNSDFNKDDQIKCINLKPGKNDKIEGKSPGGPCNLKCKSEYTPSPDKVFCEVSQNEAKWIGKDKYGNKIKYECVLRK
jgi:hypothetical protein